MEGNRYTSQLCLNSDWSKVGENFQHQHHQHQHQHSLKKAFDGYEAAKTPDVVI